MSEKIVHSTQFHELYESLSVNGKMDKNTLVIVLVMLSKGELEDKLQVLFSLIAHEEEDHAGPSRKSKSKKKMVVTRGRVEDTGNVSLSCLIMMNLAVSGATPRLSTKELGPAFGAHFEITFIPNPPTYSLT